MTAHAVKVCDFCAKAPGVLAVVIDAYVVGEEPYVRTLPMKHACSKACVTNALAGLDAGALGSRWALEAMLARQLYDAEETIAKLRKALEARRP